MTKSEAPPPGDDLAGLIEAEQRLAVMLENARRDADRIRAEASTEAGRLEQDSEAELQEAIRRMEIGIEGERQRRILEMGDQARERTRAYETVTEPQIAQLAGWVLERLLGLSPPQPPQGSPS